MPSPVLDGNDLSDFKAVITEFLLRFSGYEDLENVFFFSLYPRRRREGVHSARWITARFTAVHKTRNSRVCAPPAGVKLAKPNVFHPIYIIRLSIKTLLKLIYTPMHHPSGHVSNKVGLEKNILNTNTISDHNPSNHEASYVI